MKERRKYNRVNIPLHVRLQATNIDQTEVLDLGTRDISYSGTFIPTLTSFDEGTRFILDFTLPNDDLAEFKNIKDLKGCSGKVVRSEAHGIAIKFDNECQIENLKAL
jgi:c-di-GMP-binding flagellar brake protein YcgR